MSITPAFLDELRNRVPMSNLVGRFVTWDQRKSSPAKGDYWAPCPFHSEKTASFHVDDRKGLYYCFGCHAKGDAIGFLKDKANMDFVEAVRELSNMAGVPMPERDPEAKAKSDANQKLIDIHESAARFYALQLASAAGAQAREYLSKSRGLSAKTIADFHIGLASNSRDALLRHLVEAGFIHDDILTAGLAIRPDDGGAPFDRFRNRIMFPIRDLRGRVIAFGGRALDAAARAKYLNSNETPIFHKGRVVFNLERARNHVDEATRLIVTEGYMDVIALAQAGIHSAIAPMGTAITEGQLELIWRVDPFPIVALDGDAAGQRAARRLMEMAIGKISAGRGLRFAMLPAGIDPDDLIKSDGLDAMRAVLDNALPMVELLWQSTLAERPIDTPEERADFDARLRKWLQAIPDVGLRGHYAAAIKARRNALYAPTPKATIGATPRSNRRFNNPNKGALARTKASTPRAKSERDLRVALVITTLLAHPVLARNFSEDLAALATTNPALDGLRRQLVLAYGDIEAINALDTPSHRAILAPYRTIRELSCNRPNCSHEDARKMLVQEINHWLQIDAINLEIEEISQAMNQGAELEKYEARLHMAIKRRNALTHNIDHVEITDQDDSNFLHQFLAAKGWRRTQDK